MRDARAGGYATNIGRVFGICGLRGSELPPSPPLRKYKGRFVFQGNNVRAECSRPAIFEELSPSPATLEASKAVDAFGLLPGNDIQQRDAEQAYVQSKLGGTPAWVRLPKDRWPVSWAGVRDPVCPLIFSLYGHPDAGGYWERHCAQQLLDGGSPPFRIGPVCIFISVEIWL